MGASSSRLCLEMEATKEGYIQVLEKNLLTFSKEERDRAFGAALQVVVKKCVSSPDDADHGLGKTTWSSMIVDMLLKYDNDQLLMCLRYKAFLMERVSSTFFAIHTNFALQVKYVEGILTARIKENARKLKKAKQKERRKYNFDVKLQNNNDYGKGETEENNLAKLGTSDKENDADTSNSYIHSETLSETLPEAHHSAYLDLELEDNTEIFNKVEISDKKNIQDTSTSIVHSETLSEATSEFSPTADLEENTDINKTTIDQNIHESNNVDEFVQENLPADENVACFIPNSISEEIEVTGEKIVDSSSNILRKIALLDVERAQLVASCPELAELDENIIKNVSAAGETTLIKALREFLDDKNLYLENKRLVNANKTTDNINKFIEKDNQLLEEKNKLLEEKMAGNIERKKLIEEKNKLLLK